MPVGSGLNKATCPLLSGSQSVMVLDLNSEDLRPFKSGGSKNGDHPPQLDQKAKYVHLLSPFFLT